MLQHLPCPSDSMFETAKTYPTLIIAKVMCTVRILDVCPSSVQKVTKMMSSSNMVLLTFFGSTLPDRVHTGPFNLRLANSQFINIGSARRELLYRQKDGTAFQGLTKRHRGFAESLDLAQLYRSKVSTGAHNRESSRNRSAMVPPVVSVQPPMTPRPPMTGKSDDGSHHSLVGRKTTVQRPVTSQLPVSSRRFIISSQVSHRQHLQKVRPSTTPK
ncbi:hypothetical protein E2C01_081902 [Portunus trituberculatus]|uniref:Uncharacterized protein n=1 Tax=Portunus trituberculatus TaxID=210409 RepID=A0A5B7IXV2_PORTR|nr:hypothetical protein [Portunus trituberculatus]